MMNRETDSLPLSALQHLVYCPRQCALIHVERQWVENVLTAKGRLEHERTHAGYREFRRGKRQISGLRVFSDQLGLHGQIDILELDVIDADGDDNLPTFGLKGNWQAYPVEFKHGQPKQNDCDRVQLCAQTICLEEMLGIQINEASLFYQRIRRRENVAINENLRKKTVNTALMLHELFRSGQIPPPVRDARCKACSLKELCMPKKMGRGSQYRQILFKPQEFV